MRRNGLLPGEISRLHALLLLPAAMLALALVVQACSGSSGQSPPQSATESASESAGGSTKAAATRPNIIFILTDDLSWDLVQYMPHVVAMQRSGMTFSRYYVSDSLCC